jgi:NAD(P)-dependent dehydrogenase (short-subunit alcohol dehydrogenase family)
VVVGRHVQAFLANDLDALMADFAEDALLDAPLRVSVLCPGFVDTPILRHSRAFEGSAAAARRHPAVRARLDVLRAGFARGLPPAQVAEEVVRAIREERFYILTHPEYADAIRERADAIRERADAIVQGRTPAVRR